MRTQTDLLTELHRTAAAIEAEGGAMTPKFVKTRAAWQRLVDLTPDHVGQLTAAVLEDHDPAEVEQLLTLACASAAPNPAGLAEVHQRVARTFLTGQREEFGKTARKNYDDARARFNKAAAALTESVGTVDPDADPADLMGADEAQRAAWGAVQVQAAELDDALRYLRMTAAQVDIGTEDADTLALACDPGTRERRAVWTAWDTATGRAGRWAALIALGIPLGAPEADKHKPYRRPKPIETRYLRTATGLRPVDYDPETGKPEDAFLAGASI